MWLYKTIIMLRDANCTGHFIKLQCNYCKTQWHCMDLHLLPHAWCIWLCRSDCNTSAYKKGKKSDLILYISRLCCIYYYYKAAKCYVVVLNIVLLLFFSNTKILTLLYFGKVMGLPRLYTVSLQEFSRCITFLQINACLSLSAFYCSSQPPPPP